MKEGNMSEVSGGAPASATPAVAATNTAPVQSSENVLDQLDPTIQEARSKEPTPQEIKELKKKIKAKANGKDVEYDIDFNDDKKLQELVSKALGADEKFQEAALTKKQMTQLAEMLSDKKGVWEVMKHAGHNPEELVNEFVEQYLQEKEKSPEQKELERIQKERDEYQKKAKQLEDEKISIENQRIQQEYERNLEQEIDQAFKEMTDLPKSPYTVRRLAATMHAFIEKGHQISVKQAADIVRRENARELQDMFSLMPEEAIEQLLGENNNKRLRARRMAKAKEVKNASQIKSTGLAEIEKELHTKSQPKTSAKDFFKKLS